MPFVINQIDGGLDLVSSPVFVAPGRLQDCSNFEVAINQGVKSVDGFERFDGGVSPTISARNLVFPLQGIINPTLMGYLTIGTFNFGTASVDILLNGAAYRTLILPVVSALPSGGTTGTLICFARSLADSILLGKAQDNNDGYSIAGFGAYDVTLTSLDGSTSGLYKSAPYESTPESVLSWQTVSAYQSAASAFYSATRDTVQPVPGQGNVLGLFWLKDELYACRDYLALAYNLRTDIPNPGDELYMGASYATATWKGFLAKEQVTGSAGQDGNFSGSMMFYNTTGTPSTGTIYNHTKSDVATATITATSAASYGAGLYRADGGRGTTPTTQSWQHMDIGWNVTYKDGVADFVPANRIRPTEDIETLIQSTDWVVPYIIYQTGNSWIQGGTWSAFPSADGLQSDDGDTSYFGCLHTATGALAQYWVNTFGLTDTDIPDGSTVTGFTVEVKRRAYRGGTATGNIRDYSLQLKFPASAGLDGPQHFANQSANWPISTTDPDDPLYATATYGGSQSLLGYNGVTPDDVKHSDFGFAMSTQCVGYGAGTVGVQARVTMVRIKVHFVPPQSKIYFWDGSTAVSAEVVMPYKVSGSTILSTAAGQLFLMNVGSNRAVGANEEIRTYPSPGVTPDGGASDGSTLIAKTQTSVERNVMDWGALLSAQKSKYQYAVSNFYAAANFEAIYGVSGAGPAFMYDGYAFTRIYTGTPIADDIPRHVSVHQLRMFLGYKSGSVQYSVAGNPLSFDPLNFAGEIGVGSAVRGLMELNGDTLAELTQQGVSMIQGDVGLTPYPGVISPDVGCVEYTAQSMGQFMYTSFRGVQNLRATQSYGDFDTSQFSWDVWSFLRPRVQTSEFFESANIGVINSLAVRNKSQYRLMFADGKQLTATFLREGEMPQYTIQDYANASGNPLTWDVVTSGVESNGRDRLFGATNDGTGYVYEIDRGNSFDGHTIDGHVTLVFDDQRSPFQNKRFTDCQVYGVATDYATFTMSRSVNYGEPDPAIYYTHTFGSLTAVPTGEQRFFSSATPVRIFGRNIALRFDINSSTQSPVTIQAIAFDAIPAGEKRT